MEVRYSAELGSRNALSRSMSGGMSKPEVASRELRAWDACSWAVRSRDARGWEAERLDLPLLFDLLRHASTPSARWAPQASRRGPNEGRTIPHADHPRSRDEGCSCSVGSRQTKCDTHLSQEDTEMTTEFGLLLPTREAVMSGRPETGPDPGHGRARGGHRLRRRVDRRLAHGAAAARAADPPRRRRRAHPAGAPRHRCPAARPAQPRRARPDHRPRSTASPRAA